MKITIDIASELDARGLVADIEHASRAIERHVRSELEFYFIDLLESAGVNVVSKDDYQADYDAYFDTMEKANKKPLSFDEWLDTQLNLV